MAKKSDQVTEAEAVTVAGEDGAGAPIGAASVDDTPAGEIAARQAEAAARAAEEQAAADKQAQLDAMPLVIASGILLSADEFALAGPALLHALQHPSEPHLIFGQAGEVTHLKPVAVAARDFVLAGERLLWTGNLEPVAGPEFGPGRSIDAVGLAISADGPVVALCALSPFTWAAGSAFAFGPGHFVF